MANTNRGEFVWHEHLYEKCLANAEKPTWFQWFLGLERTRDEKIAAKGECHANVIRSRLR